ncbi:putative retrotransposon hot spot protein 4 (RHS4) [Trypanosoma vivax]|nr:putative retrotransposon hot spot protein 4 (RHS4) [Trypanosoma vivax]
MPDPVSFPVADALYFVDVPPHDAAAVAQAGARGACASWTIVCVQMTKQDSHDTTTGAVPRLMARMRECFSEPRCGEAAALVGDGLPASPRRKGDEEAAGVRDGCRGGEGGGGHGDAHAFWSRVERCEVQLDDNLIIATTPAAGCPRACAVPRAAGRDVLGRTSRCCGPTMRLRVSVKAGGGPMRRAGRCLLLKILPGSAGGPGSASVAGGFFFSGCDEEAPAPPGKFHFSLYLL